MNKPSVLLVVALFAWVVPFGTARAQHLAVGAGVGTDGINVELAAPLGKYAQVRAGYGFATGLVGVNIKGFSVPTHPGFPGGDTTPVPLNVKLGTNEGRLLFSFHPGGKGFHITAGLHLGSSVCVRATMKNLPLDYSIGGLIVDNYLVRAHNGQMTISVCANGFGTHAFAVKPYAGIGFGRAVSGGRVGFSVDLGVQYQGKPTFWTKGESLLGKTRQVQLTDDILGALVPSFSTAQSYLKWLSVWPTLSANVYVLLF